MSLPKRLSSRTLDPSELEGSWSSYLRQEKRPVILSPPPFSTLLISTYPHTLKILCCRLLISSLRGEGVYKITPKSVRPSVRPSVRILGRNGADWSIKVKADGDWTIKKIRRKSISKGSHQRFSYVSVENGSIRFAWNPI